MDFSTSKRALQSLGRRNPPLPEEIKGVASLLLDSEVQSEAYVSGIDTLLHFTTDRWEGLAVGLLLATQAVTEATKNANSVKQVYIEGPRVPLERSQEDQSSCVSLDPEQTSKVASWLFDACTQHLEHAEPRVRTFVAKAVGALVAWSLASDDDAAVTAHCGTIYRTLVKSIDEHIQRGRKDIEDAVKEKKAKEEARKESEENNDEANYSATSTGALDDTTGWRALETNWQCLACWIAAMGPHYFRFLRNQQDLEISFDQLLAHCHYSAVTHVNRHVRAAGIAVLEQLVVAAKNSELEEDHAHLTDPDATLRKTILQVLKVGLADNWSQVRMAASVLNRVLFTTFINDLNAPTDQLCAVLLPRMCLNRFYLAQGVKLYSHETWHLVFANGDGVGVVSNHAAAVCRYYVKMCDANNHVVREAACQAIAELAVKLGQSPDATHRASLQPFVPMLLQALLVCFHDESWPVRDEACLACGTFCRAYPDECEPELWGTLWSRWTEHLTDQIWSVRADAAVALGDAVRAYGGDVLTRVLELIDELLPSARSQPTMTRDEYKALQNNIDAHTDSQLYSCGSLAPKLGKKSGAGRIGCSSCGVTRPKQPWEATDGCVYLVAELLHINGETDGASPNGTVDHGQDVASKFLKNDNVLLPLLTKLADVCRVSHFPQADELRATLWRQLPGMFESIGKLRVKRMYLELFLDLLMSNLQSSSASAISKHAAVTCAYELGQLIGPNILRGRVDDPRALDDALRQREMEIRLPMHANSVSQTQFSPFEPPGLLDHIGKLPAHPGAGMSMMGVDMSMPIPVAPKRNGDSKQDDDIHGGGFGETTMM